MPRKPFRRPEPHAICAACGNEKAQVVQRLNQIHEPDVDGTYRDEITKCDICGEETFTLEQAEASARAYAAAVARARNSFTAERIYELRLSLGFAQTKMEKIFSVGPKTWGRWERGLVPPSGPAARLMWMAENERHAFLRMAEAMVGEPRKKFEKVAGFIARQGPGEPAVAFRLNNEGGPV